MPIDSTPEKQSLYSFTRTELGEICADMGMPAYRADQIWRWLYVQRIDDWSAMKNMPSAIRDSLAERWELRTVIISGSEGNRGGTQKLLLGLRDGESIETVVIPATGRETVCISSQVGCRYACGFCASGQAGYVRDLDASEMVQQVLVAGESGADKLTNVVFMGIGEPFDNYDAVLKSIRIINDGDGLSVGARRITVSTCGVIPGINRLAGEGLQVELSVSLHSADSDARSEVMPVNRKYPLSELMDACRDYVSKTGRIVTFEYTLIRGLNDGQDHARRLGALLKTLPCRANLIPLSPVEEYEGRPTSGDAVSQFAGILTADGINTTVRASKGGRIGASCGQLRARRAV